MAGKPINTYMFAMPINQNSPNVRIFFSEEEVKIKNEYKVFCVQNEQSMSSRLKAFIKMDLAYWQATGEVLDLNQFGTKSKKLPDNEKEKNFSSDKTESTKNEQE